MSLGFHVRETPGKFELGADTKKEVLVKSSMGKASMWMEKLLY